MTRDCCKCGEPFEPRVKTRYRCDPCKRAYDNEYWAKTKAKRNANKKRSIKAIRLNRAEYVYSYLTNNHCIDCDESDPVVLEFDHQTNKDFHVSEMMNYSIRRIDEEISKCVVRCANCHRRKTAIELGWFRAIYTGSFKV